MRRIGFITKLKSSLLGTALVALLGFGFQSAALPVHTAVHAAIETAQFAISAKASPSDSGAGRSAARTIDSDCDLCALASHQAIHFDAVPISLTVATIELRSDTPPVAASSSRVALLPPARAPPARG